MPTPKCFNGPEENHGCHRLSVFTKLNVILLFRIKIGLGKSELFVLSLVGISTLGSCTSSGLIKIKMHFYWVQVNIFAFTLKPNKSHRNL